ncbi:MAG: glycine zipper 2TM domain-containing protein [Candidatus Eiseniibacteriota bacterium]
MIRTTVIAGVAALSLGLAACQNSGTKETIGTLGGAAAGGAIGSQIGQGSGRAIAIGVGVLLGGLVGNQVGRYLDQQDRQLAVQNANYSLENGRSGQSSEWRNPDNGHYGTFTPQRPYDNSRGQVCREGSSTVNIDGRQETVVNRYCRNPDGTWSLES